MKLAEPLRVGGVVIEQVDYRSLTDDQIRLTNAFANVLRAESNPEDPPTPVEVTQAEVRNFPGFLGVRQFWGMDPDGSMAAEGYVFWRDTEENTHAVDAVISVRPDRRRRGIGQSLLRLLTEAADAEGRSLMLLQTNDRVPAGEAFARRMGAEPGLAQHTNRLLLADVDLDLVRRWVTEGPVRANGYSLVAVDGRYPDDFVPEMVELWHVMNTAPRDDLDVEDQVFTVEQIRELEKGWFAQGMERWCLLARHDASGLLVGWTEVSWDAYTPKTVWQWGTGVRPEHRGHALGKWLKAVMLERVMDQRPEVEDVRTGNADSNDAMLGINRALGFTPYIGHMVWQVRLDRVRAYLDGSSV